MSATPRGKEQVKQALIEAGITLFSQRGMASVSVRDLAEEAGVNHSLLFRHFGDKETLIKAVFEERFNRLGIFDETAATDGEAMLETSIRAVMQDEQLWRLMTFAALEGQDMILNSIPSPYIATTLKQLEKRQQNNEIYNGVEASVLLASGFALSLGWAVFRRTLMSMAHAKDRNFEELRVQVDKLWEDMIAPR
ncbi:TetR/AcrR family transcriptional regulator [Oceanicoccus sp. KOV_DT_Chl]|uniref:TetR/AcrR family transcriptional regulator n=1 Tax=Oceanicoccus sp. KOV_DT_Chl TaxID=1904639 RepID=UPI000C7E615D|nr:TetR/AcrR family transcriptional regulator [Oceanicoccus sp. KOV_DT_Chl]